MVIGRSQHRIDARGKVTGEALFPADIQHEEMLVGRVLFSGQAHARMLSMDIDSAESIPGVIAILTAKDVPVNEYGLIVRDQPVLVGVNDPDSAEKRQYLTDQPSNISLWEGDQVAVVIAETEEAAAQALEAIHIEWEQLPLVENPLEAMQDNLILHPEHGSNIFTHYKFRKGDMAAGWAAADVIIEDSYLTPRQEHIFLQTESGVGFIDSEGRVTVVVAGQWAHEDRGQIAHALALPEERVRVKYAAIGGAFGGKEDMSVQIVLALAAKRLHAMGINRPIRIVWSREESVIGHHKRHRAIVKARWGATKEGLITAVESELILDAGAYNCTSNKVLGNAHASVGGPYYIPNAHIDSYAVYTTGVPGGAFRGFGGPQGHFVAESQINKLAAALNIDPIEIRLKNALEDGVDSLTQTPFPKGVTIKKVIEACAKAAEKPLPESIFRSFRSLSPFSDAIRHGRGFACAFKNVGFSFGAPESCDAIVELHGGSEIERVVLRHAAAEVGQGSHTALQQMAAEAVGVPFESVDVIMSDTVTSGNSGSVSASRMTFMAGNAIRGAAAKALEMWRGKERPVIGRYTYRPPTTTPYDPETGVSNPNFCYGYVAQIAELSVDIETGQIQVKRLVCADDVGQAINPASIEGQIEGAVVQAHGYAVTENLQVKGGRILNPRLSSYLIPGIRDIPVRVDSIILESADNLGPWGVRGMGEMPFITYAPAITAALYDATGVWFNQLPLTPERVVLTLRAHEQDRTERE